MQQQRVSSWRCRASAWGYIAALCLLPACLGPAYDTITATAVTRFPMHKMRTGELDLYYPEGEDKAAQRLAAHMQGCMQRLRQRLVDRRELDAPVVVLHRGEQNNAYVAPAIGGQPMHMVLPMHEGLEMFNLLNFGLVEVPEISCHESVHYLTFQQTGNFWRGVNAVLGDVVAPNVFFDSWFHEGMATYYEAHLADPVGRPESLLWRGLFQAGVAARGFTLSAGDMNPGQRELGAFGGYYLVGMHFVEYLAQTYGEDKLWQLIDVQARSVWSYFGVSLRFWQVYDKTLETLWDEFVAALPQRVPKRERPAEQTQWQSTDATWARLASCPAQQRVAVASQGLDSVGRITVYNEDGSERFTVRLTDILPGRERVLGNVQGVSGLSFTGDCKSLYFSFTDLDIDTAYQTRLWKLDGDTGAAQGGWADIAGLGGSVAPDGQRYVFVRLQSDHAELMVRQLVSGVDTALPAVPQATSLGAPTFSPDGAQIAFAARTAKGFNLFLWRADGHYEQLTDDDAYNYGPRWLDAAHLVFVRGDAGHLQAFVLDLANHSIAPLTDVPYALLDPSPLGQGGLVLLNADGWHWSVDRIAPQGDATARAAAIDQPTGSRATIDKPVSVLEDTPYSGWDHLAFPNVHAPWIMFAGSAVNPKALGYQAGIALTGGDRLGWHRYSLNVTYDSFAKLPSVNLAYLNSQLAPVGLLAQASMLSSEYDRTFAGSCSIVRPFWSNAVALNVVAFDSGPNPLLPSTRALPHFRVWGPGVGLQYNAAEATPYGGPRRALSFGGAAAVYPRWLGNTVSIGDLSANLGGIVPLPWSLRHNLALSLRGRMLLAAPQPDRYVRVGGVRSGLVEWASSVRSGNPAQTLGYYAQSINLYESVRGYEDFAWYSDATAIGSAAYTYPIIIDHGWNSLFYLLPSFFISQVDMQVFYTAALSRVAPGRSPWHRAVGLSVTLETLLGRFNSPSLSYQVAYRFDEIFPMLRHQVVFSL